MVAGTRKRIYGLAQTFVLAVWVLLPGGVAARGESPADRFVASLDHATEVPADAVRLIRETWANCKKCDGDEFLTQGLALFSERFRAGLDAYDGDRYGACAELMADMRNVQNPFLAVHGGAYEIKALVASERMLEAGKRIEALLAPHPDGLRKLDTFSYLGPEISFLRGACLLADLRHREATEAFRAFLDRYPNASQRLSLAARQMLAEIDTYQPGQIDEVVDLMSFSQRRLTQGDSGQIVRTRQDRVVEILEQLIEEAEQQESQSSSSSSSGSSGGSDSQGGNSPSTPMQDSMLPGGQAQRGELGERRKANPAEVWGTMPPAQRKRVLQALKDNFPARYRQLVEQYYEELAKKP